MSGTVQATDPSTGSTTTSHVSLPRPSCPGPSSTTSSTISPSSCGSAGSASSASRLSSVHQSSVYSDRDGARRGEPTTRRWERTHSVIPTGPSPWGTPSVRVHRRDSGLRTDPLGPPPRKDRSGTGRWVVGGVEDRTGGSSPPLAPLVPRRRRVPRPSGPPRRRGNT